MAAGASPVHFAAQPVTMYRGGCLCGKVRYECTGGPLFSVICHCVDCRKASGAGGVPVLGVPKNSFTVSGATRSTTTVGGSGKAAIRHVCAACGSLLFGTPEIAPDLVTIYAGSLDTPDAFQPTATIFTRSRPSWAVLAEPLTEYDGPPE